MLFKNFATDASTRLAYDWYRTARAGDYGAPTLRLLLLSPAYDAARPATAPNLVQLVWEPYWQPPVNHKPPQAQWVQESITALSGSNLGVQLVPDTQNGNYDPLGQTVTGAPSALSFVFAAHSRLPSC